MDAYSHDFELLFHTEHASIRLCVLCDVLEVTWRASAGPRRVAAYFVPWPRKMLANSVSAPMNAFMVGGGADGSVSVAMPVHGRLTRAEALALAAWLVAVADPGDTEEFPALLEAVRAT